MKGELMTVHRAGRLPLAAGGIMHRRGQWGAVVLVVALVLTVSAWPARARQGAMYRGLVAGVSTLDDTVRVLGRPGSRIFRGDHLICRYRGVTVTVLHKEKTVVALRITDPEFRDVNGLGVGDPAARVVQRLGVTPVGATVVDRVNNIVYVFNSDAEVTSIVYGTVTAD